MRVRFWGTRGSIATPDPDMLRHGGNTACVEVRSAAGTLVVVDCGTGAHRLGRHLMANGEPSARGHLLISHTHWDHIQGLPFFAPLFRPGNEWDIYGPRGLAQSLREALAGQMQYTYFPVTLDDLGATIRYHDLVEGVLEIGDVQVLTHYLNHTVLTLGYRLEADGAALVYASDHEPYACRLASGTGRIDGRDRHHVEFLAGADLVIHDAQYTAAEYPKKKGWGHSTVEYAAAVSRAAAAKRLALTHHDPMRDDAALDRIVAELRAGAAGVAPPLEIFAAAEGTTLELGAGSEKAPEPPARASAAMPMPAALSGQAVLLGVAASPMAKVIAEALRADGVPALPAPDAATALGLFESEDPALVLLERDLPPAGGLAACRAIRELTVPEAAGVPVVIVAPEEDAAAGAAAGATDWLVEPFSSVYARTRIRAWLLRSHCRWQRAPLPADEEKRLEALRRLGILDTRREERFDRLTRLATALFDVPIALVSLVDRDRQWLKSVQGLAVRETSREVSFCAHAILRREVMVIPDARLDPRFADNPVVTGEPCVRFYAGCPLLLPGGTCAGTLCILDTRPRDLDAAGVRHLQDLASLVEHELARTRGAAAAS